MSGSPALILLDPIGLKSLPAEVCRPLFQRPEKTDVFIILHFKVLHRTAGMLLPTGHADPATQGAGQAAETFDAVFGSPRWRFIACQPDLTTLEREQRYLKLYYEDVLGPRYSWECAFPVRPKYESAVKYWLVQASDYIDAFTLMNDEIVKLDTLLFRRSIDDPEALEGFIEAEIKARYETTLVELGHATVRYLSKQPGGAAPFSQIREALLEDFFGRVKWTGYGMAIRSLCKSDELEREQRVAAAFERDAEMIRLVTPGMPQAGAAIAAAGNVVPLLRHA